MRAILFCVIAACGPVEGEENMGRDVEDLTDELDGVVGSTQNMAAFSVGQRVPLIDCQMADGASREVTVSLLTGNGGNFSLEWGGGGAQFQETITMLYTSLSPLVIPLRGSWFRVSAIAAFGTTIASAFAAVGTAERAVIVPAGPFNIAAAGGQAGIGRPGTGPTTSATMPITACRVKVMRGLGSPFTIFAQTGEELGSWAAGDNMDWLDIGWNTGIVIQNDDPVNAMQATVIYELCT